MTANRSLDDFATPESDGEPDDERGGDDPTPDDATDDETTVADPDDGEMVEAAETVESTEVATGDMADADASTPAEPAASEREALEPPASTYAWHPEGGLCEACGDRVDERWRDGEDLVCADCKEW